MPEERPEKILEDTLKRLQLEITQQQKRQLIFYNELLQEGLKKQRIIGEKSPVAIISKQYLDSLFPLTKVSFQPLERVVDLGSGGGFPGLPLAIVLKETIFYLLDSNQRKAKFLEETARRLKLENVFILCGRAEQYGRSAEHRERYNYVLSKAVARTSVLAELALPFLQIGGQALLYKGPAVEKELAEALKAIEVCGGEAGQKWDYILDGGEKRVILTLNKIALTPEQYPRLAGKPAKKPLC
jgi:16S rRNA (guanine527-N7)-methyltransferase